MKNRIYNIFAILVGVVAGAIMWTQSTLAVIFTSSWWVELEASDIAEYTAQAQVGVGTLYESLKLLGLIIFIAWALWLIRKIFSTVTGMFGGSN